LCQGLQRFNRSFHDRAALDANHVSDLGEGIGTSALQSAEPSIIGTDCHGFVV
jgi:hypothetical protein